MVGAGKWAHPESKNSKENLETKCFFDTAGALIHDWPLLKGTFITPPGLQTTDFNRLCSALSNNELAFVKV
ncbi:MAG: hypothetical protein A2X94_01135 [Bdellovibrionales bacterium GWB1_55_8]|nr:MAG: hypothetical protein A2X94_01135 [Bdellovibrionales bacterium GWB1_55_8]